MDAATDELIKHRDIIFMAPQKDSDPASLAVTLLQGIDGILDVKKEHEYSISVTYHLHKINLRIIEDALQEIGFHLDNSLFTKIKRALFHYTEETQLANMGYEHAESKSTTEIFINRYNQLQHGCRDERTKYYRQYN
ncbi:MAG: hypothetical protein GXP08_01775 [Gammaproteobacteria bacterium]|nr:hypothetical protein [Gammaproteobacteria bacterium]